MNPQAEIFGPKAIELFDRLQKAEARATMTHGNLVSSGGALDAEQGKDWLNSLMTVDPFDNAQFLGECDYDTCGAAGEKVDYHELDDVGDLRLHSESSPLGIDAGHYTGETTGTRTITPLECDLRVKFSYQRIWKLFKKGGADEIKKKCAVKFKNEILNTFINGDDDSTAAGTALMDSWIKKSLEYSNTNKSGTAWTIADDMPTILNTAIREMAAVKNGNYLRTPGMSFHMSLLAHQCLLQKMQAKTADTGYKLYDKAAKDAYPRWGTFDIKTPAYWPDDLVIFTPSKNLWGRVGDEISGLNPLVEYYKDIFKKYHYFVMTRAIRPEIAIDDMMHVSYDTGNASYVTWAA